MGDYYSASSSFLGFVASNRIPGCLRQTRLVGRMQYSYSKFLTELGLRLRTMRKEHGWTLRDMIVLHGFHLTHWQSFEKGKAISVPSLLRVCEIFKMPLETLIADLGRDEESPMTRVEEAPTKQAPRKRGMDVTGSSSPVAGSSASSLAASPSAKPLRPSRQKPQRT